MRTTAGPRAGARPTLAMPVPGGEAQALGLRAGVADHEREARHRRGGEDAPASTPASDAAGDDADVDEASPQRSKTESMNAPSGCLAGRARERAVEQVEDATDEDDDAADQPLLARRRGTRRRW